MASSLQYNTVFTFPSLFHLFSVSFPPSPFTGHSLVFFEGVVVMLFQSCYFFSLSLSLSNTQPEERLVHWISIEACACY